MADIITFQPSSTDLEVAMTPEEMKESVTAVFSILALESSKITDIVVFYKTSNTDINLVHSSPSLQDKSVMSSLLQYDIFDELRGEVDPEEEY